MSILSCQYQSTVCNPERYQLFHQEAPEIFEYIQETLLELTQPMMLTSFPPLNLAFAIDLTCLLQSDAKDLELIEVQISAYRLEILLRSLQEPKVVEINEVQAGEVTSPHASSISDSRSALRRRSNLDSQLKRELLAAGEALRLSLLPYLNTERLATASVAIETSLSLVGPDNQLDSNQTRAFELPPLDEFKILEELENINPVSSELMLQTANLLVWLVDSDLFTLPYDRIETNLMPQVEQIIHSEGQDFLQWQQQTIPIYRLAELLDACTLPKLKNYSSTQVSPKVTVFSLEMRLMLIVRQGQQLLALESALERLVTQPELIIQPFPHPHSYCYGFSCWEDRSWLRVIDVEFLLSALCTSK